MNSKLTFSFAIKNMKANKILLVPFILSSSLMLAMFFIMSSFMQNEYVLTRHKSLPIVINFAVTIVAIFTFVFIVYANRFLVKRRNKEFALYGILGLEKKHVRKIIFTEQVLNFSIIIVLSIIGGYLLGKFAFLILNMILKDVSAKLSNYPFSQSALIATLMFILLMFVVLFIINVINIRGASSVELLSKQHKGEGEPKFKKIIVVLGFLLLGIGYYIAMTTEGNLKSMLLFFLASLLVIFGTYMLFTSFSIMILKSMKNNKKYYYKDKNFLSVSGMLYRMKANAIGLASIAVLCTSVIITISATTAIYSAIESQVSGSLQRNYEITSGKTLRFDQVKEIEAEKVALKETVEKSVTAGEKIQDLSMQEGIFTYVEKKGNEINSPGLAQESTGSLFDTSVTSCYLLVNTLDSYNSLNKTNYKLGDGEVLIGANEKSLLNEPTLKLIGKDYKLKKVKNTIPKKIAVETYMVVVPDRKTLKEFSDFYKELNVKESKFYPSSIILSASWDVSGKTVGYENRLGKTAKEKGFELQTREEIRKTIYELNGGFLFIGIIIGMIFLIGTILITYYKQISEGYEDRENFQIMKKVGLPDELIRKTLSVQIVWMFFIPLIVALIHSIVASKIVYQLLQLFGVQEYFAYSSKIGIVIFVFAVLYMVIYKVTSNMYYKIVR